VLRNAPAAVVVLAGVAAALHVGKLPPALPALQAALGLSLVQAAFLLSAVQGAGMLLGLAGGALADALGARRSLLLGLTVLSLASAAGALATAAPWLLALRTIEGIGFMLAVLPAPGLVRRLAAPGSEAAWLGVWGAYMPAATALALLLGPAVVAGFGWPAWWLALAGTTLLALLAVVHGVPEDAAPSTAPALGSAAAAPRWAARVRMTLAHPGPWAVALAFGAYSAQWLAVIGFLPLLASAGALRQDAAIAAPLTALAAAANILGNVAAGRLLQRGVAAPRLLLTGFATMAAAGFATFAELGQPGALRWAAVAVFSAVGGLIPATLFATALRLAPSPGTQAATVGWMQQGSSLGQFAGPPLVAALASTVGGWQWSWVVLGVASAVGALAVAWIARLLRQGADGPTPQVAQRPT
jgi:MFS transporter, CP family, cyanate transporter